ncbi:MAG: rhomboid family intramembrane serine protease, partial [Muribaculaceae bacterium]|nr:rhomboid family intramembrane serine protease [Muribaculaceae bacterium]
VHMACNMVMLYYFGQICVTLGQERYLLVTYLCGGVLGGVCYTVFASFFPSMVGSGLIGASAAVIAVGVFAAFISPRLQLGVWLLGEMQLRWIVVGVVGVMCVGALAASVGELITHLGGVAAGMCMYYMQRFRSMNRHTSFDRQNASMENLDNILDKVKRSGYSSLNARERKSLFEISNKLNQR